jgi:hypothetical protein
MSRQALRLEVKHKNQTLLQKTSTVERCTILLKCIHRFREIQQLYMPGLDLKARSHALNHSSSSTSPSSIHVEDTKLHMPSDLSDADRRKYCPNGLAAIEDRLRYGEASDALENLRHQLRTRSFTNRFKVANVTGQIHNTRARETQAGIDNKVRACAIQYRRARAALLKLRGNGSWEDVLKVLDHSDVRALNERELTAQEKEDVRRLRERNGLVLEADEVDVEKVVATVVAVGEGQRRPSWIWFTGNIHEGVNDALTRAGAYDVILLLFSSLMGFLALRVEWAKTKARGDRWEEEVVLLDEEMRRVLVYCRWKEIWWIEQIPRREGLPANVADGLHAYAHRQADMERRICSTWTTKWAHARTLAEPILSAALGAASATARQELVAEASELVELHIEEDHDRYAADSDFEE